MRGRRLAKCAIIVCTAIGLTFAAMPQASAATGAGGLTILFASVGNQAHQCNVISSDSTYQAVVCADIVTYEGAGDYYAYGRAEAICQTASPAHTIVPCQAIEELSSLQTGTGGTAKGVKHCGLGGPACPDGRLYDPSPTWDYSIALDGNVACSSSVNSANQVWGLAWNSGTIIWTPDGKMWELGYNATGNDGDNESSGHYFVCP